MRWMTVVTMLLGCAAVAAHADTVLQYSYMETDGLGSASFSFQRLSVTAVNATPEPGSLALLATGALGFAGVVRRRLA